MFIWRALQEKALQPRITEAEAFPFRARQPASGTGPAEGVASDDAAGSDRRQPVTTSAPSA